MTTLKARIMNKDFKKAAKIFIILSLIIIIFGGILTGLMFGTQANEVHSYFNTLDNNFQEGTQPNFPVGHYYNKYEDNDRYWSGYMHNDFFRSEQFTQPSTGAMIVLGTYLTLLTLLFIAYWLLITAWLYQAATKASMNGLLWALLGFFFNLYAVIAFLVIRSFIRQSCYSCGARQKPATYCIACGTAMKHQCSECGELTDPKDSFCSKCGKALKDNNTVE
jgi:hypothetical protein